MFILLNLLCWYDFLLLSINCFVISLLYIHSWFLSIIVKAMTDESDETTTPNKSKLPLFCRPKKYHHHLEITKILMSQVNYSLKYTFPIGSKLPLTRLLITNMISRTYMLVRTWISDVNHIITHNWDVMLSLFFHFYYLILLDDHSTHVFTDEFVSYLPLNFTFVILGLLLAITLIISLIFIYLYPSKVALANHKLSIHEKGTLPCSASINFQHEKEEYANAVPYESHQEDSYSAAASHCPHAWSHMLMRFIVIICLYGEWQCNGWYSSDTLQDDTLHFNSIRLFTIAFHSVINTCKLNELKPDKKKDRNLLM